jgi:hypothetical protein
MSVAPFFAGCLVLFATGRALVLGAASASGNGLTREDDPMIYWFCIAAGVGIAVALFYISFTG